MNTKLQDIAALMIETGMRPSEILNLKREDVHLINNFLQIRSGKTKSARRRIPLSETAKNILTARLAANSIFLFPDQTINTLNYWHGLAVKRSGIAKCRLYDLRHTFATLHIENETDVVTLAALLGHKDLKMILRYAHPFEKHKQEAVLRLEKRRAKAV